MASMGSRAVRGVVIAIALVSLAGCSSVPDQLRDAAGSAAAATSGAALAVRLHHTAGAPSAITDTVLSDALTELETAGTDVTDLDAATDAERAARSTALEAVRVATDAVLDAREKLASGEEPSDDALASAAAALEELGS